MELKDELIDEISMVFPCDLSRMPLFVKTLSQYQKWGMPKKHEIIVPSRTFKRLVIPGLKIKVVPYEHNEKVFCPTLALNLGVKATKYKNVLIGHPEVQPMDRPLHRLFNSERGNYVCKVYDTAQCGCRTQQLVGEGCRDETPGLYFLACYRKEDIEKINGWDMRFMQGSSNEDIDFGQRMVNAGIPFMMRDDIEGEHQWHKRVSEKIPEYDINRAFYEENKKNKVTRVENGLNEV